MNHLDATNALRTLAAAVGLDPDTMVVAYVRGESHTGVVCVLPFPWRFANTMTTTPHDTEEDALAELVLRARAEVAHRASNADAVAETARNEAQVALLRAAEAEAAATAMRAALAATGGA